MNKSIVLVVGGLLALGTASSVILYRGEVQKTELLRRENIKTGGEAQAEIKKLKEDISKEREKNLADNQKLVDQLNRFLNGKEKAQQELERLKKSFSEEKELSVVVNEDLNKLRAEVAKLRKDKEETLARLEESSKKKKQTYETRILSLEAQLAKAKSRLTAEAERYHYNLGVVCTQNKDFDSAVSEFKTAVGYNPKNVQAHYNLGIIFDDYFKDKENARFHYRRFLELEPNSDDAESVKEWLANLDK